MLHNAPPEGHYYMMWMQNFDFAYTLFSGDAFGTSVCTFYRLRTIAHIIHIFHTFLFDNAVDVAHGDLNDLKGL